MERISIYASSFFDAYGTPSILGGYERYIASLIDLLKNNNYDVDFHQTAAIDFEREYNGVKCYGWQIRGNHFDMIDFIHSKTADKIIYMYLGQQVKYKPRSVVVSHGIFWDYNGGDLNYVRALLEPALNQTKLVSVDLNTINFIRAYFTNYNHNAMNKMFYIPNFADTSIFKAVEKDDDYITVLYPRRICTERGFEIFKNISSRLLSKHSNVKIHFAVDKNNIATYNGLVDWIDSHNNKDRISYNSYSYDDMAKAYQMSDISVIPTLACEGTSYSACEAMACGNAVVSTWVGGLSNLILDGHNGLLVNPNESDIYNAIEKLVLDEVLRIKLGKNAINTVFDSFSKKEWDRKWLNIVDSM